MLLKKINMFLLIFLLSATLGCMNSHTRAGDGTDEEYIYDDQDALLNQDSDGDMVSDYEERQYGTNPDDPNDVYKGPEDGQVYTDDPDLPNFNDLPDFDPNDPGTKDMLAYLNLIAQGTSTVAGLKGLGGKEASVDTCMTLSSDIVSNGIPSDVESLVGMEFHGSKGDLLVFEKGGKFTHGLKGVNFSTINGRYFITSKSITFVDEGLLSGCVYNYSFFVDGQTCIGNQGSNNKNNCYMREGEYGYLTRFELTGINAKGDGFPGIYNRSGIACTTDVKSTSALARHTIAVEDANICKTEWSNAK